MILYHGSRKGIEGKITPAYRSLHNRVPVKLDFGEGFYCGTRKDSAVEWVVNNIKTATISGFEVDDNILSGVVDMRVHRFRDDLYGTIEWALFVAYNRFDLQTPYLEKKHNLTYTKYPAEEFPFVFEHFAEISRADIIIGAIADDNMQQAYESFLNNAMGIDALSECLKVANLGTQYVFKTEKACDILNGCRQRTMGLKEFLAKDPGYSQISLKQILKRKEDKFRNIKDQIKLINWQDAHSQRTVFPDTLRMLNERLGLKCSREYSDPGQAWPED